jgi:hypothetical protein
MRVLKIAVEGNISQSPRMGAEAGYPGLGSEGAAATGVTGVTVAMSVLPGFVVAPLFSTGLVLSVGMVVSVAPVPLAAPVEAVEVEFVPLTAAASLVEVTAPTLLPPPPPPQPANPVNAAPQKTKAHPRHRS